MFATSFKENNSNKMKIRVEFSEIIWIFYTKRTEENFS